MAYSTGQVIRATTSAFWCRANVVQGNLFAAYTGKTGEAIKIRASDDFQVVGVGVVIRDTGGTVLEQGPATVSGDGAWTYAATTKLPDGQQVVIEVTATDRPGHKTTKTQAR